MTRLSRQYLEAAALIILTGFAAWGVLLGGEDFYQHFDPSYPTAYPQWLGHVFRSLFGGLPPQLAFALYASAATAALFVAYRRVIHSAAWVLALCIWPMSLGALLQGQLIPFFLLGLSLSISRVGWQSGLYSSVLWLKPHLALGLVFVHLSRRDLAALAVHILIGVLVMISSLLAPGRAAIGSEYWTEWFFENPYVASLAALIPIWPLQIAVFALALGFSALLAWQQKLTPPLAMFLNLAFVPYLMDYDLILLSPTMGYATSGLALLISSAGWLSGQRWWILPFWIFLFPSVLEKWRLELDNDRVAVVAVKLDRIVSWLQHQKDRIPRVGN